MPEFICKDPATQVLGVALISYLDALNGDAITAEYGFSDIQPCEWYSYQPYLHLLHDLAIHHSLDLFATGVSVTEHIFKQIPQKPDIWNYFLALISGSSRVYRGADVKKWITANVLQRNHVEFCDASPHPCDYSYGALYGGVKITRPANCIFSVTHRDGDCRKHGDDHCIYDIQWWEETQERLTK